MDITGISVWVTHDDEQEVLIITLDGITDEARARDMVTSFLKDGCTVTTYPIVNVTVTEA